VALYLCQIAITATINSERKCMDCLIIFRNAEISYGRDLVWLLSGS